MALVPMDRSKLHPAHQFGILDSFLTCKAFLKIIMQIFLSISLSFHLIYTIYAHIIFNIHADPSDPS